MRQQGRGTTVRIGAAACAAAVLFVIAAAGAAPDRPLANASGATAAPPAPQASPAPEASPAPQSAPSPAPSAAPPEEPLPRIIRTVCTDRVCGGCDGRCRKSSGHVAVDKKGHCACTPAEGSALDRAIRQAYERRPPQ
jgi:pyruvate/2-oxoglutarate dehydrogenase complex dihydrolipoamide acyltransferase (E2) component